MILRVWTSQCTFVISCDTVEGVEVDGLVLGLLVQGVDERGVGGAADDGVAVAEAPVDG